MQLDLSLAVSIYCFLFYVLKIFFLRTVAVNVLAVAIHVAVDVVVDVNFHIIKDSFPLDFFDK